MHRLYVLLTKKKIPKVQRYSKLLKLKNSFENGKILKEGIKTAIIGKPNVGKSSLLNLILGENRAIVSDIEGTTRDTIEEYINIKGIPLKIVDTAGIRKTNDEVEKIGVERSINNISNAELIIALFDDSRTFDDQDQKILDLIEGKKTIILINKIDLGKNLIKENEKLKKFKNNILSIFFLIMKLFKKNQVIIYVISLMLVAAGYLNYTANGNTNSIIPTSGTEEELDQMANIGDAQLVSSNDIVNEAVNNTANNIENAKTENTSSNTVTTSSTTTNTTNNSDYFKTSKLERDTMYSQMIETYEKVLNSDNSLETQKQSATDEIKKINDTKNSIMICENLIQTKGFENSVVFVNGESVSVIIEASELSKEQVAQIQNIISREMNAKAENIHISNK